MTLQQEAYAMIGSCFAFYLTQRNNDVRVRKEVYRKILQAVQDKTDNMEQSNNL